MRVPGVWDADRAQAALNVFGGAAFAVGSLLFLNSALVRLGIAFFVVGSFAMLAGALAVWNQRYAPGRPPRTADVSALTLEPAAVATVPGVVTSAAAPGTRPADPPGD
jgi:VanZ family protein